MCRFKMYVRELLDYFLVMKTRVNIRELSELDTTCKMIIKRILVDEIFNEHSLIEIQAVLDYTYERINIGNWKDVKAFLRKTMTIASYLKLIIYITNKESNVSICETDFQECFKILDHGLLFGCPLDCDSKLLQNCASVLNEIYFKLYPQNLGPLPTSGVTDELHTKATEQVVALDRINCPSMEYFFTNFIKKEKPVIITNCINHWPALQKWIDLNYLLKVAGKRTVPIEIGIKYTDEDWTQKLMTLEEFIKQHIYQNEGSVGYLAQYQLFEQIPELKDDIIDPEYCCFSETEEPIDINAWYGPKGTVSPLHYDPKKNLLAQVIGNKEVFLFSPCNSEFLYPHESEFLNNTARVDPSEPKFDLYPRYKEAKGYHAILKPGEILYIPPKWWHYIKSLSISFSVSFWWS